MKKINLKNLFIILLLLIIQSCSSDDGDSGLYQSDDIKLSYDNLISKTFELTKANASKAIDYNGKGVYETDIINQLNFCFASSSLTFYKGSNGVYRYEFLKPSYLDDSKCINNNSTGTFVIDGNKITFTDDDGNIWDIWQNAEIYKYNGDTTKKLYIDFSKNWVSNDKKQEATISYRYFEQ